MPKYKLTYFDGRGLAEVSRILFVAAGQEFEDVRITQEEWPSLKAKTKFGKIPILEFDGKMYSQSTAIANYLAREFGFYGKNSEEALQIDQVLQLINELYEAARKTFMESDEARKAEANKNFAEVETPKYLGFFELLLKENGTGYFVGNSLTVADIAVQVAADGFNRRMPGCLEPFPLLKALCQKVESNERIKNYLANRKDTDF